MKFRNALLAMVTAAAVGSASAVALAAVPAPTSGSLTALNISADYVAGVSSGGYMANQLHVAYSSVFKGAGIFTAGPYDCAQDDTTATTAQYACMSTLLTRKTPAQLEQETRDRAAAGTVDPVSNLSGSKVYLYHGTSDTTVAQAVNDDLATYYSDLGANVVYNKTTSAGHAWVSPLGPNSCSATASPYLNDCGNDPEHDMLTQLLGSVQSPAGSLTGALVKFGQDAYAPGGSAAAISMDSSGYAYIPMTCASGASCTLLVALHGCKQGYAAIGDAFMKDAHLNEYADTNHLVVLYPQATTASGNPNGCWNWWGYGGDSRYAQHGGRQIEAVMNMVRALTGTTTTSPSPTPTPTPTCVTASNYAHTVAGRAYVSGGYTYALGSNAAMGLWSVYVTHTLKQTAAGYWTLADGQC